MSNVDRVEKIYRTFIVLVQRGKGFSPTTASAINRQLNIKIEEKHPLDANLEDIAEAMLEKVDVCIEERGLDIPPHQTANEVSSAEILNRLEQEEAQRQALRAKKSYTFKVAAGVQGKRIYFVACVPMEIVEELFIDFTQLPPEERYQRIPSKGRIREMKDYLIERPTTYLVPPVVATIEGDWEHEPGTDEMTILPGAKCHLIDGSHRKEGIVKAIKEYRALAEEDLPVMFVCDRGLPQRQQWFSDTNRKARKPHASLSLQFDHHDREANFNRNVVDSVPLLAAYTNREQGSVGGKTSNKLFVLTWLHEANKKMRPNKGYDIDFRFCTNFWKALVEVIPQWKDYDPTLTDPQEIRNDFISCHGVTIKALAEIGKAMNYDHRNSTLDEMVEFLLPLSEVKWEKDNPDWIDRIVSDQQKILTRPVNVKRLTAYLKAQLIKGGSKIPVSSDEKELEPNLFN